MFKFLIGFAAVACSFAGAAVMLSHPSDVNVTFAASFAFTAGLGTALFMLINAGRQPVKPSILQTKYTGKDTSNDNPILHRGGTLDTVKRSLGADQPQRTGDASKTATSFVVGNQAGSHLQVNTEPQADGTVKITVVAVGYSGSQFKQRVRPRLSNIRTIKWQHPTNLGENKRQMEGVITGNPGTALSAISSFNA